MKALILYYKKFVIDITFKIKPYNTCVANRVIEDKQYALTGMLIM